MDILEILGRIGFDWRVFLFNLINFIIVAALLQKFFFSKVMKTMEERQRIIDEGIRNSERAKKEIAEANDVKKRIISEAKIEASKIVKDAVNNAQDLSARIKSETEDQLAEMKSKAKENLQEEKKKMLADFRNQASNLVVKATKKILNNDSKNMSDKDVEKLLLSSNIEE